MLWFIIWTVLVLGTLAGAYVVGRRLWRSAVALGHELGRASDVAAQLTARAAELEEQARTARQDEPPALGRDPQELRDRVEQLRGVRREQRARRRAGHRTTVADATSRWFG
ncbi:hypothetical protein [Cellulomonas sp. S1-8]|uniref:hypothetical protein n=1 Tax=Cellulomonas sp. S1-8 TaxID=2904790 RepID=UPI002242DF87|nr:hypothetical protein [Cellulomonas sp. S1-8]UZN05203.1 hypothetical protein OKX07_10055 [Cellulomonas sp. S1-8]